jgi:hypothetical protein
MKGELLRRGRGWQHAVRLVAASLVVAGSGVVGGCLTRPLQPEDTRTTSTVVERLAESAVDKIDLLFMVDNSRSMADKQTALAMTLPDLVRGLVNPNCVDSNGNPAPPASQPAGPLDACPDPTTKRDFTPILDIHIGVVTSSLGGHGSDACPDSETFSCAGGATNTSNNDHGHLVSRLDACMGGAATTYQGQGYLAWDPTGKKDTPPGESNLGSVNIDLTTGAVTTATPGLVADLKDMVIGTGQLGCGYEAQMEGWYRFLIDPDPPESLELNAKTGDVTRVGIDNTLLQQRTDFLRPDSLLAIIAITDENDASVKEEGQFYLVYQQRNPSNPNENFHLPTSRQECNTNPLDPCCRSCGQDQTGCPTDPTCTTLNDKNDDVNLREWHQKQRFGIDFYYPYTRYVEALTQQLVPNNAGEMVANPIFTNLNPSNNSSNVRDASLVFLACITGVPWQDIAVDPTDLTQGFKTPTQMAMPDAKGHTTWDYIMGKNQYPVSTTDPNAPLDPHMYEDDKPRTGTDPITGDVLAPPSMTEGGPDKINGHEYTPGTVNGVQDHPDDIEYACIFQLPAPRDCSNAQTSCDCTDPMNDNALCAADPNHNGNRTLQTHAKAYPAIREMFILHDLGNQGITASICPAQLTNDDPSAADFGYRPAVAGIITRLKAALGGQCLPRQLTPNATGEVQCLVLEAINSNGVDAGENGLGYGGKCDAYCDSQSARQAVTVDHQPAVQAALADPTSKNSKFDCFCEIKQLAGTTSSVCTQGAASASDLQACQCDPSDPPLFGGAQVNGWCYVDDTTVPPVGNPAIVKNCPESEKRLVRFVGAGNPKPGGVLFITCAGE